LDGGRDIGFQKGRVLIVVAASIAIPRTLVVVALFLGFRLGRRRIVVDIGVRDDGSRLLDFARGRSRRVCVSGRGRGGTGILARSRPDLYARLVSLLEGELQGKDMRWTNLGIEEVTQTQVEDVAIISVRFEDRRRP
jgi:hypothetical protein